MTLAPSVGASSVGAGGGTALAIPPITGRATTATSTEATALLIRLLRVMKTLSAL